MPVQSLPVVDAPRSRPAPSEPVRPRVKRRKGLNALSDAEVWDYTDREILDAACEAWRSPVYDHYTPSLERHFDHMGEPERLVIRFNCKYHSPYHFPPLRDRSRTCDGTRNLLVSARACDAARGVSVSLSDEECETVAPYSVARHRAILAIRCARDRRSFESVVDDLHWQEVQLLRPGTELPCSATVSNDVRHIYEDPSVTAAQFLQNVPGVLHLAVDGWTCPTSESYLGLIVFWTDSPGVRRTILEFIRLTESHTGDYMAERMHDCLRRFGIEDKIMSICLDNAANNNTLVSRLQERIPNFRGPKNRVRCIAHIYNLMGKSFMSPFSEPSKRSKNMSGTTGGTSATTVNDPSVDHDDPTGELDPDKLEHDEGVILGTTAEAIRIMAQSGMIISSEEFASARQIMPKVAGLARRVNDSPVLATMFADLVDRDPELKGDSRALTRRVATRWNTDRAALNSHLHFKAPVQMLTGNSRLKLRKYALSDDQWALATELSSVLEVFQEPTDRFSQAEVPLIHETLPELLSLRARLYDIRDDLLQQNLRPITRVAAEAALLVFDKYMGAMEESDIYVIAVVMCPDRKLKWFADRGYDTNPIRARVIAAFTDLFPPEQRDTANIARNTTKNTGRSIWTQRHSSSSAPPAHHDFDSIEAYLDSAVIGADLITQHGGILSYWSSELTRRARVARMALNYLTVPASSVDAERAFSGGRLMINHLQHQMSSRTFQAQMAIGSWFETPLLPNLEDAACIIKNHM